MLKKIYVSFLLILFCNCASAQSSVQDTVYLMNGLAIGEKIIDTTLGAVTIYNPKKHAQRINYEWDQLYMIRYANGNKRYYYRQDSLLNNVFTRDEMWLYMKGENDARKGFKARGALVTGIALGFVGGATGTFWGPVAPFSFMALSGVTKIKIKAETISNPAWIDSDAYILGYERVARQKRKVKSLLGGGIGLVAGYLFFAALHNSYPQSIYSGSK
ncbi:MAG: hypothetical protein IT236_02200 [Bacteroidia bacterium]|nr:hypothetical protein [Bacteroidia bacterium]